MKVHLYDVRWIDSEILEFQASFEKRQFAKKQIKIGDKLSMEVSSDIFCAGFMRDGVWSPCSEGVLGRKKCESCRAKEGNFIFTAFDGFSTENYTPADLEKLQGEHVVYFALFDKDLIKVGVSRLDRKFLRQWEQGSHFSFFVAQAPDGILARQIESVLRKSGMIDKVRASLKKDFFCPEITKEAGEKILTNLFLEHKKALADYENLKPFLLENPEFKSWNQVYGIKEVIQNNKSFHSVKLQKGESVSGAVIAKKGAFIVLELPHELVSICVKDLIGQEIEFSEKPEGLILNQAFQSALF